MTSRSDESDFNSSHSCAHGIATLRLPTSLTKVVELCAFSCHTSRVTFSFPYNPNFSAGFFLFLNFSFFTLTLFLLPSFVPQISPIFYYFPAMTSSSPASSIVPPVQAAHNEILVRKICRECEIPKDCKLEVLGSQYSDWRNNPSVLPPGSIVVSDLHLQNLRLPLPPFFHYFLAIHDIHLLQLTGNSIRVMSGFILLNLIKDLGLTLEDFHTCYVRVRSGRNPKFFLSPRKGWVCFTGTPSKDYDPKHFFLLTGNWQSPLVNTSLFPMRRGFNFRK